MTKHLKITTPIAIAALTLSASITLAADVKWDMPMAYSASNYHSENGTQFAKEVTEASGGKLEIVAHPGGSLFKGGEIFRAVRTGQAPIGERLISALGNEDPLFENVALNKLVIDNESGANGIADPGTSTDFDILGNLRSSIPDAGAFESVDLEN